MPAAVHRASWPNALCRINPGVRMELERHHTARCLRKYDDDYIVNRSWARREASVEQKEATVQLQLVRVAAEQLGCGSTRVQARTVLPDTREKLSSAQANDLSDPDK
nr:unnamed protein product [Callosobruchus chinensis]